jgi:cytochrome oxidase assembly protein ShyY1
MFPHVGAVVKGAVVGVSSPTTHPAAGPQYGRYVLTFLRRPKWIILGIAVVVMAVSFVSLGFWQLGRLQGVRDENVRIVASRSARTLPAAEVLRTDRPPAPETEYQRVTATGRYDQAHEVLVRGRQVDVENGLFVVTPLVTGTGATLLVARGWIPPAGNADRAPAVPPATPGEVTVVGRVRPPETGTGPSRAARIGKYLSVTRILPREISSFVGRPAYDAYVELVDQTPPPAGAAPTAIPQGTLDEGNHESYAYQWFTFAVIAVGGFVLLAVLESRKRRTAADAPDRLAEPTTV